MPKARKRRDLASEQLAGETDPAQAKSDNKQANAILTWNTFELIARTWLAKTTANRAASRQEKNMAWLEKNIFPVIGKMPVSTIKPRDVLTALHKFEA